jgi:uncharacterized protein (UPF0276 family)
MSITAGIGLKPQHFDDALACRDAGLWFEVHPENYLAAGGPRPAWLAAIAARHPLSLHGVGLSLASEEPVDSALLDRFAELVERTAPVLVSEHLAWSRIGGVSLPDLLPIPRTGESLAAVAANIDCVQSRLKRPIAIENPTHYLQLAHDWPEVEFLAELARRTGCGLLVDVNNVFVGAHNTGCDAQAWIDSVPGSAVVEVHLAGHSVDAGGVLLVDSHDAPVAAPVWALYERLIGRIGARPTLIERDADVPSFEALLSERAIAHQALIEATWARAA